MQLMQKTTLLPKSVSVHRYASIQPIQADSSKSIGKTLVSISYIDTIETVIKSVTLIAKPVQ